MFLNQDMLDYRPGRKRRSQKKKKSDKDWEDSTTNEVDWSKLDKFLSKHAKRSQRFVEDTFSRVRLLFLLLLGKGPEKNKK